MAEVVVHWKEIKIVKKQHFEPETIVNGYTKVFVGV